MKKIEIDWINIYRELYIDKNMSLGDIAHSLNCGKTTVARHLKQFDLPTRSLAEAIRVKQPLTDEKVHELHSAYYVECNMTIQDIADNEGVSRTFLNNAFRRLGLSKRNLSEALKARRERERKLYELAYQEYTTGEKSYAVICKQLGKSRSAVIRRFRGYGFPPLLPPGAKLSAIQEHDIIQSYVNAYKSPRILAAEAGVSPKKVRNLIERAGIPTRSISEGINATLDHGRFNGKKSRKISNPEFFYSWTPQLAWVLGLIWSDGNLYQSPEGKPHQQFVSLRSIDKDVIVKVANLVGGSPNMIERKAGSKKVNDQWVLTFSRPTEVIDRLREVGLHAAKAASVSMPVDIPTTLKRHFIRGYIEGDGSFAHCKNGDKKFYLCGRSPEMIIQITETLFEQANIRRFMASSSKNLHSARSFEGLPAYKYKDKQGKFFYCLSTSFKEALALLVRYLYNGVDSEITMDRKRVSAFKLIDS